MLDIKDFPVLNMDELPDVVKAAHEVAHSADAFIIVTPECALRPSRARSPAPCA